MQEYNFNFEINRNIEHFIAAFDSSVIKRYNKDLEIKEQIKPNYLYGPKAPILMDMVGQADHVKLPVIAVTTTGMARDNERIKNKQQDMHYKDAIGNFITLQAIPYNISVQMNILCRYAMDLDQILTNFIVHTNPYIIYSWREPKTGKDIRTEVLWDGNVSITYPGDNQTPKDFPHRIEAAINFTIKAWIFRTETEVVKPICIINTDYIPTDKLFCDYDTLTAYTEDFVKDQFEIEGRPKIQYINP